MEGRSLEEGRSRDKDLSLADKRSLDHDLSRDKDLSLVKDPDRSLDVLHLSRVEGREVLTLSL